MQPVVSVSGLSKRFKDLTAVHDLSFEMTQGQVLGFIGANGAGKTTTMRIMATLDVPSTGRVQICGKDCVDNPSEVRRSIGWMPDSYGTYPHTTVWEYLDFFARSFGLEGSERVASLRDVMQFTDLEGLKDRPVDKLSKGMGQRLCLGRALLHDPPVLILDEPAAGLDPRARVEFKRLVRLLANDGKTIFISSHILSELDEMCDTVLFIDAGRVIHHGSADSLKQASDDGGALYSICMLNPAANADRLSEWLEMTPAIELVELNRRGARVRLDDSSPETAATTLKRLLAARFDVVEFKREERRLEEAFIQTLETNGAQ